MSNPSNEDTAATLEYHNATKHSEWSLRASRHFLDWENQPLAFKIYRDLEAIPLPQRFPDNALPALEAISPAVEDPAADGDGEKVPDLAPYPSRSSPPCSTAPRAACPATFWIHSVRASSTCT